MCRKSKDNHQYSIIKLMKISKRSVVPEDMQKQIRQLQVSRKTLNETELDFANKIFCEVSPTYVHTYYD